MSTTVGRSDAGAAPGVVERVTPRALISLAILTSFYLLFALDKQIFALVANLLVDALGFTDTELGLLQGFVYSIPYSLGVLAVGWIVDRFSRRGVLFLGVFFWSLAAASSGLAMSFASMAMARACVGLGEAALLPAALPLIAAIFPRDKVSSAVGFFFVGSSLGGIFANLVGGYAVDVFVGMGEVSVPVLGVIAPWQAAFIVTGLPGCAIAFLAWGLMKPPSQRVAATETATDASSQQSLGEYLREHWFFMATFAVATSSLTLCSYTLISWAAPYYGRTFDWSHSLIGAVVAMGMGIGAFGNPLWGMTADWLRRRGHMDSVYRVFIPLALLGIPLCATAFLVKQPVISVVAWILTNLAVNAHGANVSALQLAAPAHLRGRLTAIKLVVSGVVGLGAGPVLAGVFADHVFGRDQLGPSILAAVTLAALLCAGLMIAGRGAFIRAMRAQEAAA